MPNSCLVLLLQSVNSAFPLVSVWRILSFNKGAYICTHTGCYFYMWFLKMNLRGKHRGQEKCNPLVRSLKLTAGTPPRPPMWVPGNQAPGAIPGVSHRSHWQDAGGWAEPEFKCSPQGRDADMLSAVIPAEHPFPQSRSSVLLHSPYFWIACCELLLLFP